MTKTTAVRILICVVFGLVGWRHFILGVRSLYNPQGADVGPFVHGLIIAAMCVALILLAVFVPADWCSAWL